MKSNNFIEQIVLDDINANTHEGRVHTRFPPEPNGYLHIGHVKAASVNFGLAQKFGGLCNLRFDDTNPTKEEQKYVEAIKEDLAWLGFQWHGQVKYASAYFETLYQWALHLIDQGLAYVCNLSAEQAREHRGTLTEPGKNSPYRDRSIAENRALLEKMRTGEFAEGHSVLRAKIDMSHPNINMRDPILYRIIKKSHHQTSDKWCIYPTYDFAHGQEDAIEGITHSVCSLEFADHKPLYDWFIEHLPVPYQPKQYEFARLNLNYTITSKRKLRQLVEQGHVNGWDDPRLPTVAGLRRRGVPPCAILKFCEMIGVTRSNSVVDMSVFEYAIRDELNQKAPRAMAVLNPLKVVISNYPEGQTQWLELPVHPQDDSMGKRKVAFSKELYIDRGDFAEVPPRKWKRLANEAAVRLRGAYVIRLEEMIKDDQGEIIQLNCIFDEQTLGKNPEGYKAKGVIHWVSAAHCKEAEVRLYDRLFDHPSPDGDAEVDFLTHLNKKSLEVIQGIKVESSLSNPEVGMSYQFEREGYFCRDKQSESLVFNRTISLRDSWAKINADS